jgi:hypothetical protein
MQKKTQRQLEGHTVTDGFQVVTMVRARNDTPVIKEHITAAICKMDLLSWWSFVLELWFTFRLSRTLAVAVCPPDPVPESECYDGVKICRNGIWSRFSARACASWLSGSTQLRAAYAERDNRKRGRRLLAKLILTFVSKTVALSAQRIATAINLGSLERSRYFFIHVTPQLSSWSWVDPVPDPLLLRNLVAPGIESGASGSVYRNSEH